MIKIDTVYQTVLALANKEQRGYITPQEFNLFAEHAQMSIFEQYFYDLNQFKRVPGNQTDYADMTTILEDKISPFIKYVTYSPATVGALPEEYYRDYYTTIGSAKVKAEKITRQEAAAYTSPLTSPTKSRPTYYTSQSSIYFLPHAGSAMFFYIKKPAKPEWSYVVVNEKPLYNPSGNAVDFELHPSEQKNLVNRILKLAGVSIEDAGLVQVATQEEIKNIRQEKA
ncbi:hypothetical protein [Phenylobacterium sp.]|uniref:hypothetical protein n=1 Tax=Phenylobacterium sp. TaxID=1871053 RepID=UPI0025E2397C|nr:hypothetical protein [Phenylobacterium sp.]